MNKVTHDIESYRDVLRKVLMHYANVPMEHLNEFIGTFSLITFKNKSNIISPGTMNNKLYFVINGIVKIYYIVKGKEIISDFKQNHSFFINGYTVFTGLPNFSYYETLEDTTCLVTNEESVEYLSQKYHSITHLRRKIAEAYYTAFLKANYNKLFLSAEERFDIFMKERALLANRISQKQIALHLGITPETLSRLRAKQLIVN